MIRSILTNVSRKTNHIPLRERENERRAPSQREVKRTDVQKGEWIPEGSLTRESEA